MTMEGTHDHSEYVTTSPTWQYTYLIIHRQGLATAAAFLFRNLVPRSLRLMPASGLATAYASYCLREHDSRLIVESRMPVLISAEPGLQPRAAAEFLHTCAPSKGRFRPHDSDASKHDFDALVAELGSARGPTTSHDTAKAVDTVFIDIDPLSHDDMARLDRALRGGLRSEPQARPACRVIAATHHPLPQMTHAVTPLAYLRWAFIHTLRIPPLRERADDLMYQLVDEIGASRNMENDGPGKLAHRLAPGALQKLKAHRWEWNLLEFCNVVLRAIVLSHGGRIEPKHILFDGELGTPAAQNGKRRRGRPMKKELDPATLAELVRLQEVHRKTVPALVEYLGAKRGIQISASSLRHQLKKFIDARR